MDKMIKLDSCKHTIILIKGDCILIKWNQIPLLIINMTQTTDFNKIMDIIDTRYSGRVYNEIQDKIRCIVNEYYNAEYDMEY